jgi:hypothetical protein
MQMLLEVFRAIEVVTVKIQGIGIDFARCQVILKNLKMDVKRLRTEEKFDSIYHGCIDKAKKLDIDPITEKRSSSLPIRYQNGTPPVKLTEKEKLRKVYFEVIDTVMASIDDRFQEQTLPSAVQYFLAGKTFFMGNGDWIDTEKYLSDYFGDEFDIEMLKPQRDMLLHRIVSADKASEECMPDQLAESYTFATFSQAMQEEAKMDNGNVSFPELGKLISLIMILPATSAECERSFSNLRRLKTYLRSTMGKERLNGLALMHAHRDICKKLDLEELMDGFIHTNREKAAVQRQNVFASSLARTKQMAKKVKSRLLSIKVAKLTESLIRMGIDISDRTTDMIQVAMRSNESEYSRL